MPTDGRNPRVTSFSAIREDSSCSVEETRFRFFTLLYFICVFFIFLQFDVFISLTAVCQAHVCHYQLPLCDVLYFFLFSSKYVYLVLCAVFGIFVSVQLAVLSCLLMVSISVVDRRG
jgi:hypothetical protein